MSIEKNMPESEVHLERERLEIQLRKIEPLCQKIEHARRNLEVMIKLGSAIANTTDTQSKKLVDEVTRLNLEILKETVNIK